MIMCSLTHSVPLPPTTYQCMVTVAFWGSLRVWPYFVCTTGVPVCGMGMPIGSCPAVRLPNRLCGSSCVQVRFSFPRKNTPEPNSSNSNMLRVCQLGSVVYFSAFYFSIICPCTGPPFCHQCLSAA